jgi:class 3 adenylate cyclase
MERAMSEAPESVHVDERRLAAILAADVAGYSRLMGRNEDETVRDLEAHKAAILPLIARHGRSSTSRATESLRSFQAPCARSNARSPCRRSCVSATSMPPKSEPTPPGPTTSLADTGRRLRLSRASKRPTRGRLWSSTSVWGKSMRRSPYSGISQERASFDPVGILYADPGADEAEISRRPAQGGISREG